MKVNPSTNSSKNVSESKKTVSKPKTNYNTNKNSLLKTEDFKKWNLSEESMEILPKLIGNDELAKQHMLPKETKEVTDKQYLFNYFSNQMHDQAKLMIKYNYNDICDHMITVGEEQAET